MHRKSNYLENEKFLELNPKVFTHVIYIALQDFSIKSTDTTNKDNNNHDKNSNEA